MPGSDDSKSTKQTIVLSSGQVFRLDSKLRVLLPVGPLFVWNRQGAPLVPQITAVDQRLLEL